MLNTEQETERASLPEQTFTVTELTIPPIQSATRILCNSGVVVLGPNEFRVFVGVALAVPMFEAAAG